jgi:hypothetical protein
MPESKSGALPLGDIPMWSGDLPSDTRSIITQLSVFGNPFFADFAFSENYFFKNTVPQPHFHAHRDKLPGG